MGYKRLSEQPSASVIKDEDSIIGVFDGKLGLANVADWLSKINASFDISVDSDTAEEYILSITVGRKTVTTPNLKAVSIQNARIELGHLYFDMSDGTTIDSGYIGSDGKKYGVCYDFKSKNPKLTRLGDAKHLKSGIANGVDDTNVVNDFDKMYPWCDIKRCTIADDGTITSYEGDPNYTENGSIGQVMTEIPEHYRMTYISEATGKIYHYVSREKLNEYYKYVPKTYIGSFLGSDNYGKSILHSVSGPVYYDTFQYSDARSFARARGGNWHLFDIWDYETVKTLFMIEFATINSQSLMKGNGLTIPTVTVYADEECMMDEMIRDTPEVTDSEFKTTTVVAQEGDFTIGDEIDITVLANDDPGELDYEFEGEYAAIRKVIGMEPVDISTYPDLEGAVIYQISGNAITIGKTAYCMVTTERNGLTNEIKASSGKIVRDGKEGMSVWRGIESLVGEGYTFIDGVLLHDNKYWVCNDINKYANSVYAYDENGEVTEEFEYYPISFAPPASTGYITKMGYDETTGLTLPIETGGTSDIGYCDNFYKPRNATQMSAVRFGGNDTATAGLFSINCTLPTSTPSRSCARLSYSHSQ